MSVTRLSAVSAVSAALLAILTLFGVAARASADSDARVRYVGDPGARSAYLQAVKSAERRDWSRFDSLRDSLEDYPLAPYLDYKWRVHRLRSTSGSDARSFVDEQRHSPLGVRYLGRYLKSKGRARDWSDYLAAANGEPRSEDLRCYFARATRSKVGERAAWPLAEKLWMSGSSVDDACDLLFKLWIEAGQLDDRLVWERAQLAYAAREGGLLRYIASLGSAALQSDLDALRRSYREPQRTPALAATVSAARRQDVLLLGLERHSRYNPSRALKQRLKLAPEALTPSRLARLDRAIAYRGILEQDDAVRSWVDGRLADWADDKLTGMRLRWAIAEQDWDGLLRHLPALSAAADEALWRYWHARALAETDQLEAANELFAGVAAERGYYGFLSADRLGLPYSFGDDTDATGASAEPLPDWAVGTVHRVAELWQVEESRLALAEWNHALQRLQPAQQLQLAELANDENWHRLSIDAANASKSWHRLELRFPIAFEQDFRSRARAMNLPASELMAIARRESAFFPTARSPVGARGLMQLMPSTGIAVARKSGLRLNVADLYTVDHNLDLGSAYYRQLLERFDENRAVALAAYNAGPNRVQHWLGKGLPLDAWIETIPYRETRDYVKAVLAYSVVFDYRLGEDVQLLTLAERSSQY